MTVADQKRRDAEYESIVKLCKGHTCATCGGWLNVAWFEGEWRLRCGKCGILPQDAALTKDKTLKQMWLEGWALPIYLQNLCEKRYGGKQMDSTALQTMEPKTMMQRIELAKFPQALTPQEKNALAEAAISYGFDPLMGELTIYQGRIYVTVDGRFRKARETGNLDGIQTRPATKQEREDWQIPEGDYFYRSEVFVKDMRLPVVGWGRVFKGETVGGKGYTPVEKNPQRMAEKRADMQALRKAFSLPLPSAEEIGTESPDIAPTITVTEIKANPATGEVIEGEVVEQPAPEQAKAEPGKNPKTVQALRGEYLEAMRGLTQAQRKTVMAVNGDLIESRWSHSEYSKAIDKAHELSAEKPQERMV